MSDRTDSRFVEPSEQWLAWHEEADGNRNKMWEFAERDVGRYQEALREIVKLKDDDSESLFEPDYWTGIDTAVQIASAALGGGGQ